MWQKQREGFEINAPPRVTINFARTLYIYNQGRGVFETDSGNYRGLHNKQSYTYPMITHQCCCSSSEAPFTAAAAVTRIFYIQCPVLELFTPP